MFNCVLPKYLTICILNMGRLAKRTANLNDYLIRRFEFPNSTPTLAV